MREKISDFITVENVGDQLKLTTIGDRNIYLKHDEVYKILDFMKRLEGSLRENEEKFNDKLINENPGYCTKLLYLKIQSQTKRIEQLESQLARMERYIGLK